MPIGPVNFTVDKGAAVYDAMALTGHQMYEQDSQWWGSGPLGPAYVQGFYDAWPLPARLLSVAEFLMRIPPDKYGQLRPLMEINDTIWAFMQALHYHSVENRPINLDHPYLLAAIDYLISLEIATAEDKAAWLA